MSCVRFMMNYIKKHKIGYIGGIITLFIVDFANIFIPKVTGTITDGLNSHTFSWNDIFKQLMLLLALGTTLAIGRFFWRFFLFGAARKIEKEIRDDLFGHLETMDVEYFNENKTGDLMTRFTSDLNAIRMAIGFGVITAFDSTIMFVMVVCQMIFYVNLKLTLIAMIPMLLILWGELYYGKLMHERFEERQEALSSLTDLIQESFSGVRVIKAFVREQAQLQAFLKSNDYTKEKNLRVAKLQSIVMPLLDVVIGLSALITLIYGGYLTLEGKITIGRFIAFNQYINMLVWPMLACGESINMFSQGGASIRRIQEVFNAQPAIVDKNALDIEKLNGDITFNHLTFKHLDQTSNTLEDISLEIKKGSTIAIVGRTGSGKSTLVNLMLHLYQVEPNMILFDGTDMNQIPLSVLRKNIAYVPQDNFLFSDTLKHNIAFGIEEDRMDAIIAATKDACIHDNIIEFPDGYDTIVGERGVTLSGGQKQRSSIARALIKDAPILILDDALSAVDTDTEKHILDNLKINRENKTTILIAHRISTIQNSDCILVLDEGKAAEIGTHDELMKQNGIYAAMFEQQKLEAMKASERSQL